MADLADAAASELAVAPSTSPELAVDTGFPPLSGGVKAQMTAEKSVVEDFDFVVALWDLGDFGKREEGMMHHESEVCSREV